jgi:hypothetical protein
MVIFLNKTLQTYEYILFKRME